MLIFDSQPPSGFSLPSHLIVEPLTETAPINSNSNSNSASGTPSNKTNKNLIEKYNLENRDVDSIQVDKGWAATTGERDKQLKERKAKMILDARKKLIEKKKREVV